MRYESIADIYSANSKVRERFLAVAEGISDTESSELPDGEKWSINEIVEHISIVESSVFRICSKLAEAARLAGKPSSGAFSISTEFGQNLASVAEIKIEAPERVHPTGELSIAESLERLRSSMRSIEDLRSEIETFDGGDHKFPHPFFGELTAAEWLVVRGGHEHRHTAQIERLLEKIRN